jgi:mitochondrial fission protein ELM1
MNTGIRLLILSDNKPGHVTGSKGVVASIEKLTPVQQVTLEVRLRLKFMRYPLRLLLNHPALIDLIPQPAQRGLLRLAYAFSDPRLLETAKGFDWIVSAGGDTSFLNAWLARLAGLKNIYGSSLRGLKPSLFTVVLSLGTGPAGPNEIQLKLGPTPVDREKIRALGQQLRAEHALEKETVWAVLIGGDGAGYRYDRASMELLAKGFLALAARHNARLLITTSRRTGLKLEQTLKAHFDGQPSVAYASYFNHRPEKVVAKFLGAADAVFSTADSGAMITESMAAGKPVYVLVPEESQPDPSQLAFLQQHIGSKHIRQVALSELPTLDVRQDAAAYFHLLENDPISDLAQKIEAWIKPEASCE